MTRYLLEIGTEEIPAHFFDQALRQIREAITEALTRRLIAFDSVRRAVKTYLASKPD